MSGIVAVIVLVSVATVVVRVVLGRYHRLFQLVVTKDGGEVDALTGATITTRAFCEAAQLAYDVFLQESANQVESGNE